MRHTPERTEDLKVPVQEDIAALRDAVAALERATGAVAAQYGDTVDARRLRVDVDRVKQDLDLLVGQPVPADPPRADVLEVIEDTAYPQDFWMDAEDEGLGGGR